MFCIAVCKEWLMKNKRRLILAAALLVIVVAGLSITGISAYFISTSDIINRSTVGNNDIEILEEFKNPDIDPEGVTEITKKVVLKNTGKKPTKVRVSVRFSTSEMLPFTEIDYNTAKWEKDGDWWNYKDIIAPGETTEPLFTKLTITKPGRKTQDFNVYVYAERRTES